MENIWTKVKMIATDKMLRNRMLFILGSLAVFRLLSVIPIPGIDINKFQALIDNNQFIGVLNIVSGGGLSHLSVFMLGVGPYITSSIIMQLLTIMSPRLKAMYQEDGEIGRKKFNRLSRYIAVPLAIIQGLAFLLLLKNQLIFINDSIFGMVSAVAVVVAGSILLMWIGELISEFGIGNGLSLIIFAGIVANIPNEFSQFMFNFDISKLPIYILFLAVGLIIVAGVVLVSEAERPISVTYAKQMRGNRMTGGGQTYLPLRINQAGVIPIIFALSILLFPQLIGNFLANNSHHFLQVISRAMLWFVASTWLYALTYFIFVFLFTYFYTAVTFDPDQIATNLQKEGAFISGIRPGDATREYLSKILIRITMVGAVFLGLIAVLPLVMRSVTGITSFALGGTALLIVVSVVLDLIKKIEAQLSMREY